MKKFTKNMYKRNIDKAFIEIRGLHNYIVEHNLSMELDKMVLNTAKALNYMTFEERRLVWKRQVIYLK